MSNIRKLLCNYRGIKRGPTIRGSSVIINLCPSLGQKTLLLDTNFDVNAEVVWGAATKYPSWHSFISDKDITINGPYDTMIMPKDFAEGLMMNFTKYEQSKLITELQNIALDSLVMDIRSSGNSFFYTRTDGMVKLVATPLPGAISENFALIKIRSEEFLGGLHFHLIVNQTQSKEEAFEGFERLGFVSDRLLNITLIYPISLFSKSHVQGSMIKQLSAANLEPECILLKHTSSISKCTKPSITAITMQPMKN